MTPAKSTRKLMAFYALTLLLSLCAALGVVELALRQLEYTSAIDIGSRAYQRWHDRHWRPVNEMGFRDLPLAGRLAPDQPRLYFLGDSFTAGAGVDFEQGYFFQVAWQPNPGLNAFNLSRHGASTQEQLDEIRRFDQATGGHARVVVHQYFANDIDDHIAIPHWAPPPWLKAAARYLESAELLVSHRLNQEWGRQYNDALRAAYADPAVMDRHLAELRALHDYIRAQGGTVVFLVFPALNNEALMEESQQVVVRMRRFFAATCRPGDRYIDATSSARTLSESARRVSFLDPHPSAALHTQIAGRVRHALGQRPQPAGAQAPYERCEDLRAARTAP